MAHTRRVKEAAIRMMLPPENATLRQMDISLNESIASAEIEQHSRSILSSAHAGIEHPTL